MATKVEIKEIKVKEVCSKVSPNSASMIKLYKLIDSIPKSTIVKVDFKGVTVGTLTNDEKFKELLIDRKFSNVFFTFYGETKLKAICDMLMVVMGVNNNNKVTNVLPEEEYVYSVENFFTPSIVTESITNKLLENGLEVDTANNRCILHYDMYKGVNIMSTFTNSKDVIGIYNAMKVALDRTGLKSVLVDFGTVHALTGRKDGLADLLYQARKILKSKGYEVEYRFNDDLSKKNWSLAIGIEVAEKDYAKSLAEIKENLKPNTVGMLAEYIPNKKNTDRLGRYGNGIVHTRQPAIFLKAEGDRLYFRKFNSNTFMRRADWDKKNLILAQELLEIGKQFDTEQEFNLNAKDVDFHISEIGVASINFGSKFHFSLPIQTKESEMVEVYAWNRKSERFENVKILLPKFLQLVLDENNVTYDRAELEVDIGLTEYKLRNQGIEVPDTRNYQFMRRY